LTGAINTPGKSNALSLILTWEVAMNVKVVAFCTLQ